MLKIKKINIRNLFNSLYFEIKEIKDITNKNKIKGNENDNKKDAFLTSLILIIPNNKQLYS
jgi:hypothetical protein